jgi:hypothetical protein
MCRTAIQTRIRRRGPVGRATLDLGSRLNAAAAVTGAGVENPHRNTANGRAAFSGASLELKSPSAE